jgi:Flp pilus assembly pilin Flp
MQEPAIPLAEQTPLALTTSRRFNLSFCLRFLADDTGSDLIEYVLLAALLGLTVVVSIKGVGNKIANTYTSVNNNLTNAV